MLIDPRKFITSPFRACPKCGKLEFGTLNVGDHHISRRCRVCWHTQGEHLPRLNKKVIYLDQMILSNMGKTLDPQWGKERPQQDDYWARAFDALDRSVKLQLIICPYSRIHERESVVLPHFPVLRRLYEHLAIGIEFEWPTRIHYLQLTHALRQKLRGENVDYSQIPRQRVLHGDPTAWAERIRIGVDWPIANPDPAEVRRTRARSGEAFQASFERWAKEKKPFKEVYEFERQGHSDAISELLRGHFAALQTAAVTGVITDEVWNYRLEIEIVYGLLHVTEQAELRGADAARTAGEFLYSEEALNAPANEISALLMAALARRAAAGQKAANPRNVERHHDNLGVLAVLRCNVPGRPVRGVAARRPVEREDRLPDTRVLQQNAPGFSEVPRHPRRRRGTRARGESYGGVRRGLADAVPRDSGARAGTAS